LWLWSARTAPARPATARIIRTTSRCLWRIRAGPPRGRRSIPRRPRAVNPRTALPPNLEHRDAPLVPGAGDAAGMPGGAAAEGARRGAGVPGVVDQEEIDMISSDQTLDGKIVVGRREAGAAGEPVHLAGVPGEDEAGAVALAGDPGAGGVERGHRPAGGAGA